MIQYTGFSKWESKQTKNKKEEKAKDHFNSKFFFLFIRPVFVFWERKPKHSLFFFTYMIHLLCVLVVFFGCGFFFCSHKELTWNISIQDTNYIYEKESIQFSKMVFLVSGDKIFNTVMVTNIDLNSFKRQYSILWKGKNVYIL